MIGLKRYFEHTSWMLAEKILRLGIVFFVGIYVARYLGPEKYGILNFAVAFVALFASFADLGLNNILVRELLHKKTLSEKLIGTSFLLKIAGAGFVLLLIIILTIFTSFGRQTEIVILIICVGLVFQAFNVVELFFQSKVQAKYPVFARVFSVVLANIVKILLILFKAPLVYFAFAISLEYFLLSVSLVYVYYRQKYSVFNWHFDRSIGFDLIRESWPLILSGVAVSVYIRIDQVMIKSMLGDEATGIYSVAVNLSEAWYFIPMTLTAALYPALVNAKKNDETVYYKRLEKLFLFMVWIAIAIAIPVSIFSKEIIGIVFGMQYLQAHGVLAVHCWSALFVFIGLVSNQWFILENLSRYTLYRHLLAAGTNIVLNMLFIPAYGIVGAAVATLLTQVITSYLFDIINKPTRILFVMKSKYLFLFLPITLKFVLQGLFKRDRLRY